MLYKEDIISSREEARMAEKVMQSRLGARVIGSGIAWLLIWFAARMLLEQSGLSSNVRIAVALAPVPLFAWFVYAFVRFVAQADELQRRIQMEALAIAYPSAIVLFMTLGLLDIAIGLPYENFGLKHLWTFMPMVYFVGLAIATRRYK